MLRNHWHSLAPNFGTIMDKLTRLAQNAMDGESLSRVQERSSSAIEFPTQRRGCQLTMTIRPAVSSSLLNLECTGRYTSPTRTQTFFLSSLILLACGQLGDGPSPYTWPQLQVWQTSRSQEIVNAGYLTLNKDQIQ